MTSLWFWIPVWVTVVWLGMSIYTIEPNELVAVYLFNRRWRIRRSGWYLYPFGIFSVKRFSTRTRRQMSPGKKEDIVRDDDTPLGLGQVRAVRIIHASAENAYYWIPEQDPADPKKTMLKLKHFSKLSEDEQKRRNSEDDALESSITTEVIAFTDINLNDAGLFDFVENVGTMMEAGRRLDGTVRGALQELMAPLTARHATEMKAHIEGLIKERLEILVGESLDGSEADKDKIVEKKWGVNISAFQIEEINPGKTVNLARSEEAASVSLKAKKIREGEATAQVTHDTAVAEAFKETAMGEAKATAFRKIADVMKTPEGQFAAQLETAGQALKGANYSVLPDMAGLIGSISKVIEGVKK